MLENIPNNSMYTTIIPDMEIYIVDEWEKQNMIPDEPCEFEDFDMNFLDYEQEEFEDILKNEPQGWI